MSGGFVNELPEIEWDKAEFGEFLEMSKGYQGRLYSTQLWLFDMPRLMLP